MGAFQNAAQKNTAVAPSGNGGVFSRVASKQPVAPKENNMLQKFAQNVIARPAIRLGQATGAGIVELFGNEQQKSRIPQALAQPIKTSYLGTTAGVKPIGKGGGKQIALDAGKSAFDIASLGAGAAVNTAIKTGVQKTASALLPKATSKVGSYIARNAPGVVANAVEGVAYNTGYNALNQKPLTDNIGTAAAFGVVAPPLIKGVFKGGQKVVGTFNKDIRAERLAQKRLTELNKLNKLKTLSTVVEKGRERGIDIPRLLSETDVLHGSVDKNGTITTKGVGNAIEEYTNKYVAGNEAIVSESLKKEGRAIAPQIVQKKLKEAVNNAGIEGSALIQANKKIDDEIAGYMLRSQESGAIPVVTLHDAKVDKYNGINFFTEGAAKKYDKTIAKALKELVEEYTTDVKVKEINRDLSKHFAVIDYLERLDGRKVEGGRLGKYFARTVGAIVGGNMGPLGAVAGAEAGGLAKGQMMSRVFSGKTGKVPVQAKAITEAADYLNTPSVRLPQSSKSFGNLNTNQSTTIIPTNTGIPKSVPQLPKKSSGLGSIPNRNAGFVATGGYKESGNLTTKILKDLEGKTTVSKQYILDATNRGELKQVERDLIRDLVSREGDTVNVADFAKKVKAELLPLKVKSTSNPKGSDPYKFKELTQNDVQYNGARMQPRYEMVNLPDDLRGNVANYRENIYESPIKTSAGQTHFGGKTDNYFGHTRIEDMADNKTRRVIEVQSDLYQKGNLERELNVSNKYNYTDSFDTLGNNIKSRDQVKIGDMISDYGDGSGAQKVVGIDNKNQTIQLQRNDGTIRDKKLISSKENDQINQSLANEKKKLAQYNDPTAHFRMVREEIKKAAQDGKTKLQFPTGETAMKIEGLGQQDSWLTKVKNSYGIEQGKKITPDDLKVGMEVSQQGHSSDWIITDVLEDGKFKAVPKQKWDDMDAGVFLYSGEEKRLNELWGKNQSTLTQAEKAERDALFAKADQLKESFQFNREIPDTEQFDISGKVDTNNPIYKFYEKDVQKYLNKFGGKRVVDDKGVSWIEIPITKEQGKAPVEAFGKAQPNVLLIGAGLSGAGLAGYAGYKKYKNNLPKR